MSVDATADDSPSEGPTARGAVATGERAEPGPDGEGIPDEAHGLSARLALAAFVAYLAVGFVVILTVVGDERWFLGDEWTFLAQRDTGDLGDYFEPLNGHWVILPLLVWRGLFAVFGLQSYLPYQLPVIVLHLTTVVLLRVLMRRIGVGPWIATVAASVLVLFGSGEANIVWGFQLTLVGSLAAGLAHMLLADHDGPIDRRDWIGLGFGLVGLGSSGVAVMMVIAVGLAVLLRRGWRTAAFHTVPLGVIFSLWYVAYRPQTAVLSDEVGVRHYVDLGAEFLWLGVTGVFAKIGDNPLVAIALAVMLVVGLVLAWRPLDRRAFAERAGMPVGLALAAVLLLASTMVTRGFLFGANEARADRYMYIFVALLLPSLAVAADALARRWRLLTPVVLLLFVVGIPGNIGDFEKSAFGPVYFENQRRLVTGIGYSDLADEVPGWVSVDPSFIPDLTIGWLREAVEQGKVPDPPPPAPADANWPLRLGVATHDEPVPDDLECKVRRRPFDLTPKQGKRFAVTEGSVTMTLLEDGVPVGDPITYRPDFAGEVLSIELPDLELRFQPGFGTTEFTFCS